MKLLAGLLRRGVAPALAALGVALLVGGTAFWWQFYRDLYAEEIRALQAAVDEGAHVAFERAGDPKPYDACRRDIDYPDLYDIAEWERQRDRTPWNAPFVGRVATARIYGAEPSRAVRDDLLRLPGMRSYRETLNYYAVPDLPRVEPAFGFALPKLPAAELSESDLVELPRGEPLDAAEREAFAAELAGKWAAAKPLASYLIRAQVEKLGEDPDRSHWQYGHGAPPARLHVVSELIDGDRRALLQERGELRHVGTAPLPIVLDDETWLVTVDRGKWRTLARIDANATPDDFDWPSPPPSLPAPGPIPALASETDVLRRDEPPTDSLARIGERGERIEAVERIDETRARIVLAPRAVTIDGVAGTERIEAIVRTDFDFAVERYAIRTESPGDEETVAWLRVERVARRLTRTGETIYAVETFRFASEVDIFDSTLTDAEKGLRGVGERRLATVVANPPFSEAAFDPLSYDPTPWPRRRELPAFRAYRILWAIGGASLGAAAIAGMLAFRTSRVLRRVERSEDATPTKRRPARLRFGLASVFAAALLTISAAGVVKAKRDAAARDVALLKGLEGDVKLERREPGFPWFFFSTASCPLDAPPRRIELDWRLGNGPDVAPEATVRELLTNPDLERFLTLRDSLFREDRTPYENALEAAEAALGRKLPPLIEATEPPGRSAFVQFVPRAVPQNKPFDEPARDAYLVEVAESWNAARRATPSRYLFVATTDAGEWERETVTLRDGERCWAISQAPDDLDPAFAVRCEDGRYRFGYALVSGRDDPAAVRFLTTERTRCGVDAPAADAPELYDGRERGPSLNVSNLARYPTRRPPEAPFAFPRELFDETPAFAEVVGTLDPTKAIRVVRLGATHVQIEFPPMEAGTRGPGSDAVAIEDLAIVVREDLDYAVERCVFRQKIWPDPTNEENLESWETRDGVIPEWSRTFAIDNLLERIDERVLPVATRVRLDAFSTDWPVNESWEQRFAYDFDPTIDERIFRSPSLDCLEPLPDPVAESPFAWPQATALAACGIFAYGLWGRVRTRRRDRTREAEEGA